jgi:hypothetical protein
MTPIFGPLLGTDDELEDTGGLLEGAAELRSEEIGELDFIELAIELTTELLIEDLLELVAILEGFEELVAVEEATPPEVTITAS